MRINDNGIYRDATDTEIAEAEAMKEIEATYDPTPEERLAALEAAILNNA